VIPKAGHFFNDLAVCPQGNVYVTDTNGSKLYRLRPGGSELEALDVQVLRPNGIALSGDGKLLFVTDRMLGILRVDLATLQSAPLGTPENLRLRGIDGLYAEGRTLIALHNSYTSTQVVRYHLDASLSRVERVEVLERNDPSWKVPATGAIAEGWFYFMANSQVDRYSIPENAITPGAPVEPIRILKTKL
jgi:sugar lactone lactonase YvrE